MKRLYKLLVTLRSHLLVYLTHHIALPVLKFVRKPAPFPYSTEALAAMEDGLLGKDLFRMLKDKQLPLLTHYVKHDLKHILLGYDTTDAGEVCLQAFMLGNRHVSFPVLVTVVFGALTMPEHWSKFITAFRRGRNAPSISQWPWHQLITVPTQHLQQTINQHEKP